jgi:hypothetical protein
VLAVPVHSTDVPIWGVWSLERWLRLPVHRLELGLAVPRTLPVVVAEGQCPLHSYHLRLPPRRPRHISTALLVFVLVVEQASWLWSLSSRYQVTAYVASPTPVTGT